VAVGTASLVAVEVSPIVVVTVAVASVVAGLAPDGIAPVATVGDALSVPASTLAVLPAPAALVAVSEPEDSGPEQANTAADSSRTRNRWIILEAFTDLIRHMLHKRGSEGGNELIHDKAIHLGTDWSCFIDRAPSPLSSRAAAKDLSALNHT